MNDDDLGYFFQDGCYGDEAENLEEPERGEEVSPFGDLVLVTPYGVEE
jgi:hypothetical protein